MADDVARTWGRRWALAAGAGVVVALAAVLTGVQWQPAPPPPVAASPLARALEAPGVLTVADGFQFRVFAEGLGDVRLMVQTPQGDLVVSGYRDGTVKLVQRDADGDGRSDGTRTLVEGLGFPHGLVLDGDGLLVAEEARVMRFAFDGASLTSPAVVLDGVPAGGGHGSRTLKRGPDGALYLSIGSSCNSCVETHPWRAAILRLPPEGGAPEVFASGLRNTVGFAWQPGSGRMFGVDNGRDNLGDDQPDDEVNVITAGGHYGWPYVHGLGVADPALAAPAGAGPFLPPERGLGAHHAPLAILFPQQPLPAALAGRFVVTEHGSWNRSRKAGYRVLAHAAEGAAPPVALLEGCLRPDDSVICRPVDVIEDCAGGFFVSDDSQNAIYRIFPVAESPNSCSAVR